jgi:hypothetical protein
MNRIGYLIAVAVLSLFLGATTKAREIQFTTLPEVVSTTVFHHYNITTPAKVVRVVEEPNTIYEITVMTDSGNQVVYVDAEGNIVERPHGRDLPTQRPLRSLVVVGRGVPERIVNEAAV